MAEFQLKADCDKCEASLQKQVDEIREEQKKYITWTIFWSITGVIIGVVGWLSVRVNEAQISSAKLDVQLEQINKNITELKDITNKHLESSIK